MIQRIILADDDADDQLIFEMALKEVSPSAKLAVVKDGNALLSLLENFLPDLLFLDLEMPCKNGLECLVEIRANQKLKELAVVVFSSTSREANIQTAYEMGAHLFLFKSNIYSELAFSIRSVLSLDWTDPERIKSQYYVNGRYVMFS